MTILEKLQKEIDKKSEALAILQKEIDIEKTEVQHLVTVQHMRDELTEMKK